MNKLERHLKLNMRLVNQFQLECSEYPHVKFKKNVRNNTKDKKTFKFYAIPHKTFKQQSWKNRSKRPNQWEVLKGSGDYVKPSVMELTTSEYFDLITVKDDIAYIDDSPLDEGTLIYAPYDIDFGVYQLVYHQGHPYAFRNETQIPISQMPPLTVVLDHRVNFNDWIDFEFGGAQTANIKDDPYCWLNAKRKPYSPYTMKAISMP